MINSPRVRIEASQTSAPLYPTMVRAVTTAATALLLSACDERPVQPTPGVAPPPDERPSSYPEHITAGVVCLSPVSLVPVEIPPYEPDMKSITEQANTPLDTATSTETNQ